MIGDPVIISYFDHVQFSHSTNPETIEPITILTIGLVANETADSLTLLHEIYPNTTAGCTVPKANGLVIRKADIIEIVNLQSAKKTQSSAETKKRLSTIKATSKKHQVCVPKNEKLEQGNLRK
jgi:hypothetical protein